MTTRLYLVRHGATPLTEEDRFSGAANVFLSEEGRAQVEDLALRLADDDIAAIYCSPLDRTMETATIIAGPHQLNSTTPRRLARDQPRSLGRIVAA